MATRIFCDACGKEIKTAPNKLEYNIHIEQNEQVGYSDSEGNIVSGKRVVKDLCNKCYNQIMVLAVNKLKLIQKENNQC